jgi:hypothetical protein
MAALFGLDDQDAKRMMKQVDVRSLLRKAVATLRTAGSGGTLAHRARHFLHVARTPDAAREIFALRCDRGAAIVRRMGFPEATAVAIATLDAHWSGNGFPADLRGEAIPLLARICSLAQMVEPHHYLPGAALAETGSARATPVGDDKGIGRHAEATVRGWRSGRSTTIKR